MYKFISIFLFVIFFCSVGFTYANDADVYISAIEAKQSTLSPTAEIAYLKKTFALLGLQALRFRHDSQQVETVALLQAYISDQLSSVSEVSVVSSSAIVSPMDIPSVDIEKVRSIWLQRHNQERTSVGKSPLNYHVALESTATTWANYLWRRNGTTHRRTPGAKYYDYGAIKQWFFDQWIVFAGKEVGGQTLFTENLWWNVYSCKKTDCTDDFIAAIKKSRTFFVSEKWKSYRPHYNAIVGNYTNIWLGIVLTGNKYYLVSHYTQDLK